MSRRDYVVTLTVLNAREHKMLDQLVHGVPIGLAASHADIGDAEARYLVRQWTAAGCFVRGSNPLLAQPRGVQDTATSALKQQVDPQQPISTIEQLHTHLYQAAQVEMSTIPLYLYAAYSIQTSGGYQWDPGISAFRTIRSVVIEEMLHLCLVRNLLVATGAPPFAFYDGTSYPPIRARRCTASPSSRSTWSHARPS